MTDTTRVLGFVSVGVAALSVVLVGHALFGEPASPVRAFTRAHAQKLDGRLRFLRSKIRGAHLVGAELGVAVLCVLWGVVLGQWPAWLFLPAVFLAPRVVVDQRVARRITLIEEQIEAWLTMTANALKASPSLGEAIASTTVLLPAPMSEELDVLVKESELGTPLDQALDNMAERVGARTLAGAVLALKVARKSGGNLPEMLENTAAALRELARLEAVVRTKTAEGKAQAFVISAIPAPLVFAIHLVDPLFFRPLAESLRGHLVIAAAGALWLVALLASRKILAVDV